MDILKIWNFIVVVANILATPLLTVSYVPQIWSLYKTRTTEGIDIRFWFILNSSLLMLFIMAMDIYINTGSAGLLIAQSLNLGLAMVVLIQVAQYRKK